MSVTYTLAVERDSRRKRRVGRVELHGFLLAATSCVAVFAIALAFVGRLRAFDLSENARPGAQLVNLNTVEDPAQLESVLGTVFAYAYDRSLAARELFRYLVDDRGQRHTLPNVGAIARISVPVQ